MKEKIDYDEADNDEEDPDNEDTNIKREDADSDPDFSDSEEDEKPIVEKTVSAKKAVCESTFLPAALLLFILYSFCMDPMELLPMDLRYLLHYQWILWALMSKRAPRSLRLKHSSGSQTKKSRHEKVRTFN